jgi:hypothetical protein
MAPAGHETGGRFDARNFQSHAALPVPEDDHMRTFLGMVLGCLLTIGFVYIHDSMATSTVASGVSAGTSRQIVNWDVAASGAGEGECPQHGSS